MRCPDCNSEATVTDECCACGARWPESPDPEFDRPMADLRSALTHQRERVRIPYGNGAVITERSPTHYWRTR